MFKMYDFLLYWTVSDFIRVFAISLVQKTSELTDGAVGEKLRIMSLMDTWTGQRQGGQ